MFLMWTSFAPGSSPFCSWKTPTACCSEIEEKSVSTLISFSTNTGTVHDFAHVSNDNGNFCSIELEESLTWSRNGIKKFLKKISRKCLKKNFSKANFFNPKKVSLDQLASPKSMKISGNAGNSIQDRLFTSQRVWKWKIVLKRIFAAAHLDVEKMMLGIQWSAWTKKIRSIWSDSRELRGFFCRFCD